MCVICSLLCSLIQPHVPQRSRPPTGDIIPGGPPFAIPTGPPGGRPVVTNNNIHIVIATSVIVGVLLIIASQ